MMDVGYVFAGFVVGLIVGLTGVGGGSLMTPILIFVFGVKPYLAVGTDLLFAAVTKCGGTLSLSRQGLVPWKMVAWLSAGSLPAALVTLWVLHTAGPSTQGVQHVMTFTLGIALLLTAAAMFYKAVRGHRGAHNKVSDNIEITTPGSRPWLTVMFGALIGLLVTLTSVGAGAIGVTVLMILYPKLPLPRIIAGDIAYAVPLTLVAGLGHASLGSVDWPLLVTLLAGSLPGIYLGSRLVSHTPERLIRSALSILLAWAGSKLVLI